MCIFLNFTNSMLYNECSMINYIHEAVCDFHKFRFQKFLLAFIYKYIKNISYNISYEKEQKI